MLSDITKKVYNRAFAVQVRFTELKYPERQPEFSKGVPASGKTCRPCGSFFSPVLLSSHFFSKGCARAPFAQPLATPLMTAVDMKLRQREMTSSCAKNQIHFNNTSEKKTISFNLVFLICL